MNLKPVYVVRRRGNGLLLRLDYRVTCMARCMSTRYAIYGPEWLVLYEPHDKRVCGHRISTMFWVEPNDADADKALAGLGYRLPPPLVIEAMIAKEKK